MDSNPICLKLQSLTNCAALRLRLSIDLPRQHPPAVLECTWALEIDSNHTKALFRRGLALALCKTWNEAIIGEFYEALQLVEQ